MRVGRVNKSNGTNKIKRNELERIKRKKLDRIEEKEGIEFNLKKERIEEERK